MKEQKNLIDHHPPGTITFVPVKAGKDENEYLLFHSICSMHGMWNKDCEACNIGGWVPFERKEKGE